MATDKRKMERRKVSYYLPVSEPGNSHLIGVVIDVSLGGFKLDGTARVPIGQVRRFFIDLPDSVAPHFSRTFSGRCCWCRSDDLDPSSFCTGYEFVNMTSGNLSFFQRLYNEYGIKPDARLDRDSSGYMWK